MIPAPTDEQEWGLWAYARTRAVAAGEARRWRLSAEQRDDMHHSLFLRLWSGRARGGLAHRILHGAACDWQRRDRIVRVPAGYALAQSTQARDTADYSTVRAVRARLAILDLAPADRAIVHGILAGDTYRAIARRCGYRSPSAVSNRISRLTAKLSH